MNPELRRKTKILNAALELAETHGFSIITRDQIAESVGCSTGIINFHFGTMKQLRRAVVGEAIRVRNLRVLAQALAINDPRARKAPEKLRRSAALSITRR
jgi:AcrR family transcriptional regulator